MKQHRNKARLNLALACLLVTSHADG